MTFLVLAEPGLSRANQMGFYRSNHERLRQVRVGDDPSIGERLSSRSEGPEPYRLWKAGVERQRGRRASSGSERPRGRPILVDFAYAGTAHQRSRVRLRASDDALAKQWLELRTSKK